MDSLWNESVFSNFVCIDIDECGLIWFPNVFTPNGDQWNQYFQADSVNSIANFEIIIFNRWGTVVYESNDPFFQWDGRDQNNNKDCSTGVYFYEARIAHYTLSGTLEKKYRGSVTLLK
jgi:gliding motility-associated-like protein